MTDKNPGGGGRKNPDPLRERLANPEQIASLGLTMGYDREHIIDSVAQQSNLARPEAKRIVDDVARKLS